MVQRLLTRGKRVFLDLKFSISKRPFVGPLRGLRRWREFLTVHANRKALPQPSKPWRVHTETVGVTVLTNFDTRISATWHSAERPGLVTARALLASEVGCDGVVASGEEPAILRPRSVAISDRHARCASHRQSVDDHARRPRRPGDFGWG